jgi:hypothetical protein
MVFRHRKVNNIELAANDSMYVFVTVNINPNTANLPFYSSGTAFK